MTEFRFYTFMTVGWAIGTIAVIVVALTFAPGDLDDELPPDAVQPPAEPGQPSSSLSGPSPRSRMSFSSTTRAVGRAETRTLCCDRSS